jgi:Zn-dependent M28 family amino/carboxypeptidase
MRDLIEALCADECAGRATGTPGGIRARGLVIEALRAAGLDAHEQPIPRGKGVNVLATIPGDSERYVLVGAHYDHLGSMGGAIYRGADDNAAAVAVLVAVASGLASARPSGRGVIVAAFDAEEPPHFMNDSMGSQAFVRAPSVDLAHIDQMVCMDLVGHAIGPVAAPASVRDSLFVLGAERSRGTGRLVEGIADAVPGVVARRVDAEVIPPLSDYLPFWQAKVPFLFLTGGRWQHYHTPADTPDKLSYPKIAATAAWLEQLVRALCARDDDGRFTDDRDDASTLGTAIALCDALAEVSPEAALGRAMASDLLTLCDRDGRLPSARRHEAAMLVGLIESRLA